jgi:hypothetical protein
MWRAGGRAGGPSPLVHHGEQSNEPPDEVAERAVAAYRARIEGTGLISGDDEA